MRFLCLYFLLPANSDHSNLYWKHIFIRWWEEIYLRLADEKKCFSLFKAYDQVWQRNSLATGLQKILARRECCLLSAPDRTRNTATYIETTGAKWRRLPGDVGQESDFATRDGIYNRGLWGTIEIFPTSILRKRPPLSIEYSSCRTKHWLGWCRLRRPLEILPKVPSARRLSQCSANN